MTAATVVCKLLAVLTYSILLEVALSGDNPELGVSDSPGLP